MRKFINKKEDNVIYVKEEIWKTKPESIEASSSLEGSTGCVVPLPVNERDQKAYTPLSTKDLFLNYGVVACLLMVMGGTFYFNMNQISQDRSLASVKVNRSFQDKLLKDLNDGRRDLNSIGESYPATQKFVLRKDFESHTMKSYHVKFDSRGQVKEIQLKPGEDSLIVSDIVQWMQKHSSVFPQKLSFVEVYTKGSHQFFVFRDLNQFFYFEMNGEKKLISLVTSEER